MELAKKLKVELQYDPTIPVLVTLSMYGKDAYISIFLVALSTVTKLWNQLRYPPTDEGTKKTWCVVHIHNGVL